MIRTTLLSLSAALALSSVSHASIITLSAGFTGPFARMSDGVTPVSNGLIRLGTLTGAPASASIDDINAVFEEFGTNMTSAVGGLGGTTSNPAGTPFNNDQVYVWVFDGADPGSSTEHALFTVPDPDNPSTGNPWRYPTHTGSGTDSNTLSLAAVVNGNGDYSATPGANGDGGNVILTPIPEPSGALLAGLAGALFMFRRRR